MNEIKIENDNLETVIIPELGGRIDSLISKKNNKQWVWKNTFLHNEKVSKFSEYDDNWQGGWEELFPNDAIENFSWGKGLDHGELWSADWKVVEQNDTEVKLSTIHLDSGTIFNKICQIKGSVLKVVYNASIKFDDYFLFKLHLAIPITNETNIFCQSKNIVPVDNSFGNIFSQGLDFFSLKKNSKLFDFAYVENANQLVEVTDEDKNSLVLRYGGQLDYFWIFQTQGGWRDHNVVVLEPASNSKKMLKDAIKDGEALKGPMEFSCFYEIELN